METLQTLGLALGLATLAGLNLYMTVFATGLAVRLGWLTLLPQYEALHILAHPAVIAVSGVLCFLEFFADKVPWVDSLWDAVHTFIRPLGGAFLAIQVLGQSEPAFDVIIALLAGGVTLATHSVKAGTRLVVNHSPEPFSNVALSLGENVTVLGGLALLRYDPALALFVFSAILLAVLYFAPKLFRSLKVNFWLLWRKLSFPASDHPDKQLRAELPPDLDVIFHGANLMRERIAWAAPCVSTAARRIPGNIFGWLVATEEDRSNVWFVAKRGWRKVAEELDLRTYKVAHEPRFLSENLVLYSLEKKPKYVFIFNRTQTPVVKEIAASLQQRLASSESAALESGAAHPLDMPASVA